MTYKSECEKVLDKYHELLQRDLDAMIVNPNPYLAGVRKLPANIWDYYQDQKGGTCNG